MPPKVTIIILTWNGLEYTRACLDSLRAHTPLGEAVQVLVVDNGSTDGTLPYLRSLDWIRLIENGRNLGFVRGNNVGIRATPPDHDVLLLNNDIVIPQDGWLEEIQRVAYSADDIGIVGCRLILPDGRLLHAGTYMPLGSFWGQQIGSLEKDVNQYNANRDVEGVVGACMYIKRAVLEAIGPLDEAFFSYFEDTDYCLRAAEAGFRTVCAGGVTLIHHENVSTRINRVNFSKIFRESQKTFRKRWERKLKARYDTSVLWHSEVGSASGYAVSSRELLLQLDALGVDVRLVYIYGTDWMDTQRDDHRLAAMRQRPKDLNLPQVVYAPGELFSKNSGRYRIGYTMLEVDGIPETWVRLCNEMDEVWVPSTFNAETFRASGVTRPIHVMPLGVNPDYFNPRIRGYRPSSRYTFLSLFEWGERKAPEILLRAYFRAFRRDDDVLLLLKVINRDPGVDVKAQIAALNLPDDGPPVAMLYNQELPTYQMGSLYRSADCFVFPTRGEGWGLPILEAMACGLPVIATAWSAHTDFMHEGNAYPLRVAKLIPARAKCPYYEGFRWAHPDEDHLVHLMRHVYEHREEAAAKGAAASAEVLSRWTWRHAAQKIKARLQEIHEALT
ncbi:MAG TPA: glycosyltransferase [Chloroflexi bacterium]|nr:glycosyltransferase [Chloroflexota bacterium]